MIGRNESASFLVRMLGGFLDEDFTLLDGDELWTGGVLRALTIGIFVILVLSHLLFLSKMILHDHLKQVRQLLTFDSQLVKFVLSLHRNVLKRVFTATYFKNTDQTDQRGPSDLHKFLLVRRRNKLFDQLKSVVLVWTKTFGLGHEQRMKRID